LDLARERLLSDQAVSIASIALECGFGNLGRFAQNYAERLANDLRKRGLDCGDVGDDVTDAGASRDRS
jgi:hypothetical protein